MNGKGTHDAFSSWFRHFNPHRLLSFTSDNVKSLPDKSSNHFCVVFHKLVVHTHVKFICEGCLKGKGGWYTDFSVSGSRHSALVWLLSACQPPPPPDSCKSSAGDGLDAALSEASHTLSQGHQELSRGCTHARSWSHHGAGWFLPHSSLINIWE